MTKFIGEDKFKLSFASLLLAYLIYLVSSLLNLFSL